MTKLKDVWNAIWTFLSVNAKVIVKFVLPLVVVCAVVFIMMYSCGDDSATVQGVQQSQQSGSIGWGVLIIAGFLLFVAHKLGASNRGSVWLVATAIVFISMWAVPKFQTTFHILTGVMFGGLSLALVVLGFLAWKKRGGKAVKWGLIIVSAALIGSNSSVLVDGLKSFSTGLGIKVPSIQLPGAVGTFVDSLGKDAQNLADRKAAQTEQGTVIAQRKIAEAGFLWLSKEAELYREVGGTSPDELHERTEPVKVKILRDKAKGENEVTVENGVKLQKVRFPDAQGGYVYGPQFWVEVTKLMTHKEAFGGGISMPSAPLSGSQLQQWLNWLVSVIKQYWLIILGVIVVLLLLRRFNGSGGSSLLKTPIKIFNMIVVGVMVVGAVGGILWALGNTGGVDLFDATDRAVKKALGGGKSAVQATSPEIQIDLANLFDLSQERRMLTLNCKYQKVILTSDLVVQSTGGRALALLGSEDTGVAKLKLKSVGYQRVEGRVERTNSFLSLNRGTIIDFRQGDRTINFVASGGHRVYLVPKAQGKPIVFSYKEFNGPV